MKWNLTQDLQIRWYVYKYLDLKGISMGSYSDYVPSSRSTVRLKVSQSPMYHAAKEVLEVEQDQYWVLTDLGKYRAPI